MGNLEKAKQMIEEVRGQTLSIAERRDLAIDLATLILREARASQTTREKKQQGELARMMNDPAGKAFTRDMTDECFRTSNHRRVADQMIFLMKKHGIPRYLSWTDQLNLHLFRLAAPLLPHIVVPIARFALRRQVSNVIIPGEDGPLLRYMKKRKDVRVNINHLGEAIQGESEADHRLSIYLYDLQKPEIEYISVKVSTICSQLNLLAWEETIELVAKRLRILYRAAGENLFVRPDGTRVQKFVNLDMEEYRDLHLTVEVFKRVLSEPEFANFSAGIVLQAYVPDSYPIQQELTEWAMQRKAPIKLRIVRGANLATETVESSIEDWKLPIYSSKSEVDSNYKRMIEYAFKPERAKAVHIGIGSHNLFDIAYALLLRSEQGVEREVEFEMLEGMADHLRRVVQKLAGEILIYCPIAKKEEFHVAVAYLIRRLDENTGPENFLRHAFSLTTESPEWKTQADYFSKACDHIGDVSAQPKRTQNRLTAPLDLEGPFQNEPNTDFSLPHHRRWCEEIIATWKDRDHGTLPLCIGGSAFETKVLELGIDPSRPHRENYSYSMAGEKEVELALKTAKAAEKKWANRPAQERAELLEGVASLYRSRRFGLIGAMISDGGKLIPEADREVSEAIDFLEYYSRRAVELDSDPEVDFTPKGTVLVTPPWNFPCAIPTGGITAALATGNCVIFKPAPEVPLIGYQLAKLFWEAGIPKEVLQFINCPDEPTGSLLIKDPRINAVVLTGGTDTAKLFMSMRPSIDLLAETGGKNAIIVSELADRDLAIASLIQSAFGHSGQKCSAASLAILHKEVYEDANFLESLRDAAASLEVGSAWNLATHINPLIKPPDPDLKRGLSTLERGEEWLLKPEEDSSNPHLWSPGIKIGVEEGGYTHQTEFFGPLLSILPADNLDHAIRIANGSRYGLTSGLHSLDDREINRWSSTIEAGNLYVNRGITGAIVRRQPFGGTKASSFGKGAKAGGPNYLVEFLHGQQLTLPTHTTECEMQPIRPLSPTDQKVFEASIKSYVYWWNQMRCPSDPTLLIGEDNLFHYVPHKKMILRIQPDDSPLDISRSVAAAKICACPLEIIEESDEAFCERLKTRQRIRLLREPSEQVKKAAVGSYIAHDPVLATGRYELLYYLREVALSIDYHRYGNLGMRETEKRRQLK